MIGFVFSRERPPSKVRQNLEDIVIVPKLPKPASEESWWTVHGPAGFTAFAAKLFERRQPSSVNMEGFTRRRQDENLDTRVDLSTDGRDDGIYRDKQRDPRSED